MQDFPPKVAAFRDASGGVATKADPETRSPFAFLVWMLKQQWLVLLACSGANLLWLLPQTVGPFLLGRAVDEGILGGSTGALAKWVAVIAAVAVVGGVFGVVAHTVIVRSWLLALYATTKMTTRKAAQMGHVLPRRSPTGEVLSVASSDADEFGALAEVLSRATAQLASFLVVAGIVLSTSWQLGVLVLLAAPVIVVSAVPLLRPLHHRQEVERTRTSDLTSMATDIVAGLRILRGIGGEETFGRNYAAQSQSARRAGVSAGVWQGAVEALGVLLSGLFLVGLLWLGTRQVETGQLSIGELISFLGYGLFMVGPIRSFVELAQKATRALVSARRAIVLFGQRPPWSDPADPTPLDGEAGLVDDASGFVAEPGLLTVVVSAEPERSAALADRLGRYLSTDGDPVAEDDGVGLTGRSARRARAARARRRERVVADDERAASKAWGTRLGDVDLSAAALADVRRTVLVSDATSGLFAGTLQEAIDPHGRLTRAQAEEAMGAANAEDVYDALPEGWQGLLDERGRGLSGGQRQRVVLARALAEDPSLLVLVDPTSAVDAHTEARIAERVADLRAGRTTVVCTVSPLWLHHAEHVVLLGEHGVEAQGTHADLLTHDQAYRQVVARALDEPEEVAR